jgi:hypothetical protein
VTAPIRAAERIAALAVLSYAEDLDSEMTGVGGWWQAVTDLCGVRQRFVTVCGDELRARRVIAAIAAEHHATQDSVA